jgi:hypothetical protein
LAAIEAAANSIRTKLGHGSGHDVGAGLLTESRRNSVLAIVTSGLAVVVVVALFALLLNHLDDDDPSTSLLIASVTLIIVVVGGLLLLSDRYRRASRAAAMRAHEVSMLAEYETGLTTFQAQVLRIALAPRLFAGTADRLDVLMEPEWSSTKELVEVLGAAEPLDDASRQASEPDSDTASSI